MSTQKDLGGCGPCKTCRHWSFDGIAWGTCELTRDGSDKAMEHPESLAVACADGNSGAILWTDPNHECSQWEARDENDSDAEC